MNGSVVLDADYSEAPSHRDAAIPDHSVRYAIALVDHAGIVERIEAWHDEERMRLGRRPGGRTAQISTNAILVAFVLAALHRGPLLVTECCDVLFRRISPTMRRELELPETATPVDQRAWKALYRTMRYALHRVLQVMDPSPHPKNRRMDPEEFAVAVEQRIAERQLTEDELARRRWRLIWVANQWIEASLAMMPRRLRRQWQGWDGSIAIDATPIAAFARQEKRAKGKARSNRPVLVHSADPDAGLYVRTRDDDAPRGQRALRAVYWAYDATLLVASDVSSPTSITFPSLIVAMAALDKPGTNVSTNAAAALTNLRMERHHPAHYLAGDRAYTNAQPDDFQLPARALGYQLVLDYTVDQLGEQGTHAGALFIEGAWYCPAIPTPLIDATIDYRKERIDRDTWQVRIAERAAYQLPAKARPDDEGHHRLMCPAIGPAPRAGCELEPASILRTPTKTRIRPNDELRITPADICGRTRTFPPEAAAKLTQVLRYGSPEWQRTYATLRNNVEGMNALLKDAAHASVSDPRRRRIRGVAAQTIFVALASMATNLRQIHSFLHRTKNDNGSLVRPRRTRRRKTRDLSSWAPDNAANARASPP